MNGNSTFLRLYSVACVLRYAGQNDAIVLITVLKMRTNEDTEYISTQGICTVLNTLIYIVNRYPTI